MNILTSDVLVPVWYGAYENLSVSSLSLKHYSLLGSSSSSNAGMSSLGCVIRVPILRRLYLTLNLLAPTTVGARINP